MSKSKSSFDSKKVFLGLVVLGLLALTFYPTFAWMVERWLAKDSYYGHGPLIPMVAGFWIFKKRELLKSAKPKLTALGIGLLAASALVQIASSLLRIYFVSAFAFIGLLFALTEILLGRKILREIWYPLAFLTLMVPLPLLLISQVTLKMKFFVTTVAASLINAVGIPTTVKGSYLITPESVVLVGNPCSGLRSFLAFLCLGFVFVYGSSMSLWKKFILVSAGLPLAILSNILRVFVIGLVGEIYGPEAAGGTFHDALGIVVFLIALALLLGFRRALEGGTHEARA